jgi:ABC-2 type transport system ATP-binding protein
VLEVKGLTKRYNSIAAVDDVSFRMNLCMVHGYLEPNASGKTTTGGAYIDAKYARPMNSAVQ